eukprot:3167360-Amphidinium_carterae.1
MWRVIRRSEKVGHVSLLKTSDSEIQLLQLLKLGAHSRDFETSAQILIALLLCAMHEGGLEAKTLQI